MSISGKKSRRMKRALIIIAVFIVAIVTFFLTSNRPVGQVNALKIVNATKLYTADLQARGLTVPPTVSLQDLIDRGMLDASDVSGFSGMEVTVNLSINDTNPQAVLIRARLPDGAEIVTLADGSVQQLAPVSRPK